MTESRERKEVNSIEFPEGDDMVISIREAI